MESEQPTYYELGWDEHFPGMHGASAADGANYQQFSYLLKFTGGWVSDPPELRYTYPNAVELDWVPSGNNMPLLSSRMQRVLQQFMGSQEPVQWFPAVLRMADGRKLPYAVLHFPEPPDVLESDASTWGPGGVIRWVLDRSKLGERHVIRPRGVSIAALVISGTVLQALRQADALRGVTVERARVT